MNVTNYSLKNKVLINMRWIYMSIHDKCVALIERELLK